MSSLPKQVEELWSRMQAQEDFQERISTFRKNIGIADGTPLDGEDFQHWLSKHNKDINAFISDLVADYGAGDYEDALDILLRPLILGLSADIADPESADPFGCTTYAGFELLELLNDPNGRGYGLREKLDNCVVVVLNNSATPNTLKTLQGSSKWQEIRYMLDSFNEDKPLPTIQSSRKKDLHLLVQEARREGLVKADGFLTNTGKEMPEKFLPILELAQDTRKSILSRMSKKSRSGKII
jgi:hypothetical protein